MSLIEQFRDLDRLMQTRIREINEEADHIAYLLMMGGDDDDLGR